MHNGRLVAILNYGWESTAFYEKWMGHKENEDSFPSMNGVTIDLSSPNLVSEEGILGLFNALLNDMWIAKFKRHYKKVNAAFKK